MSFTARQTICDPPLRMLADYPTHTYQRKCGSKTRAPERRSASHHLVKQQPVNLLDRHARIVQSFHEYLWHLHRDNPRSTESTESVAYTTEGRTNTYPILSSRSGAARMQLMPLNSHARKLPRQSYPAISTGSRSYYISVFLSLYFSLSLYKFDYLPRGELVHLSAVHTQRSVVPRGNCILVSQCPLFSVVLQH